MDVRPAEAERAQPGPSDRRRGPRLGRPGQPQRPSVDLQAWVGLFDVQAGDDLLGERAEQAGQPGQAGSGVQMPDPPLE
nr:hypothetical protein [Pseudonocardia sp. Ae717_Ps2]